MSEFEYAILFVEFLNASNVVFANYMTLVFAGLTASWFLARRMTRAVAISFLLLFTLGAFAIGIGVFFSFSDFFALQTHLAASGASFPALDWLGPLRAGGAAPLLGVQLLILAILVFSWAGTLVFFWIVRRSKSNQPEAAS
ncbi:hypothetical protein L2D01_13745 [Hyphomonadaceae bacterium ML37]|nr:hypothetical protein L2D01_13745 [Hyphomonadaceae bacterium ML37]